MDEGLSAFDRRLAMDRTFPRLQMLPTGQIGPSYIPFDKPSERFIPGRTMVPIEGREGLTGLEAPGAMVPIEALPIPEEAKAALRAQGLRGVDKAQADYLSNIYGPNKRSGMNYPKELGLPSLMPETYPRGSGDMFPKGMTFDGSRSIPSMPAAQATNDLGDYYAPPPRPAPLRPDDVGNVIYNETFGPPPAPDALPYEGLTGSEGTPFREGAREATKKDPRLSGPLALLAAGLGMLSSKSPNALQAIGEGGLQGLGLYTKLRDSEDDRAIKQELAGYKGREVAVSERDARTKEKAQVALERLYRSEAAARDAKSGPEADRLRADAARIRQEITSGKEGAEVKRLLAQADYYTGLNESRESIAEENRISRREALINNNVLKYRQALGENKLQIPPGVEPSQVDEYIERLAVRDAIMAERLARHKSFGSIQVGPNGETNFIRR